MIVDGWNKMSTWIGFQNSHNQLWDFLVFRKLLLIHIRKFVHYAMNKIFQHGTHKLVKMFRTKTIWFIFWTTISSKHTKVCLHEHHCQYINFSKDGFTRTKLDITSATRNTSLTVISISSGPKPLFTAAISSSPTTS